MYPAAALYGLPLLFASVGIISYLCSRPHIEVFLIASKPFVRVRIGGFFIMRGSNVVANGCGSNKRKTLNG